MKFIVLFLILLCCCDPIETKRQEVNRIEYYKDNRTNLCFAVSRVMSSNGIDWFIYNNVPCSIEVEKLIK